MQFARLSLSVLLLLGLSAVAHAAPIGALTNADFESGLTGWNVEIETYDSSWFGVTPAGTITATNSLFNIMQTEDGGLMALMGSQSSPTFPDGGAPWDIVLSQSLTLEAGTTLSGQVFFYNGDYIAQEKAWVQIRDASGNVVATPWAAWSGTSGQSGVIAGEAYDPPPVPWQEATPWLTWTWQTALAGEYTLALGMTTRGDNTWATYVGHDNLYVGRTENLYGRVDVAEPSTLLLLGLGAFGVCCRRNSAAFRESR